MTIPSAVTRHTKLFLLLATLTLCAVPAYGATLYRDLRMGDTGEDVRALQVLLNTNTQTQVAFSGVGSPGYETDYFGPLTDTAVRRYQEVYAQEILYPLGLTTGTGFFGRQTRLHMENSSFVDFSPSVADLPITSLPPVTPQVPGTQVLIDPQLTEDKAAQRNEQNRELFIETVRTQSETRGLSEEEQSAIEESVREQASLSMSDLEKRFEEGRAQFQNEPRNENQIRDDVELIAYDENNILARNMRAFGRRIAVTLSLSPQTAYAQSMIPVGGPIYYTYLCTCSFTWLILMGPPRPGLLDYETGVQGYAGYNLPFSLYLKGWSIPVGPVCVSEPELDCAVIIPSTYGLLTFIVGSTPY
ncbi:MAG: hypothetical protein AAB460_01235 [Patescibacteria group bacterium]